MQEITAMIQLKRFLKNKLIKEVKEKVIIPIIEGHYLDNRVALITGGSSGIGYAIAESFLRNGAYVIITGRSIDKLMRAKKTLCDKLGIAEERIFIGKLDISQVNNIEITLQNIISKTGKVVDIFVNNAGVNGGNLFPNTTENDFDRIINTNLKGMYFASQAMVKYMVLNKIKGNILNVTSSSALRPAISPYILSKWGENGLTLGMAKKYLKYGIIVNGIAPGSTLTPMLQDNNDGKDLYLSYSPSKRYLAPEEIGNMATILVSQVGKMIVGDTVYMTGGAGIITYDDMDY